MCERLHETLLTYMTLYYTHMTYSKYSKVSRHIYVIFGGFFTGMLEKRSSNATPLAATRQDVPLGPILEGVLYGRWYGYTYTSVSRALLCRKMIAEA
jgi:hypothetical protein